jgi:hypothetical protein
VSALKPGPLFATRKVYARLRHRGVGEVASVARQRLRETIHSKETLIFFARRVAEDFKLARDPGLTFRGATASDANLYEQQIGTDSAATFAQRLGAGARCFFVFDGDTLLHSSWVTTGPAWTREIRRYFQPPPKDAYVYESFTRPEARGRGVYPFALNEICRHSATEDRKLVWVGAEESNAASKRAIEKAGFKEQFLVRYVRILGFLRVDEPEGTGVKLCFGCLARNVKVSG